MASGKFKPGLPTNFSLDIGPVRDLGDYLDESPPTPQVRRKESEPKADARAEARQERSAEVAPPPTPTVPDGAVVESGPSAVPPVAPRLVGAEQQTTAAGNLPTAPESAQERQGRGGRPKGPRREISMTPETLRLSDEILEAIRAGSGQRDTKANEVFHALVLLVHEALAELEVHRLPKRGRWGTPTARAYPRELKNAFLRALLRWYARDEQSRGVLRLREDAA